MLDRIKLAKQLFMYADKIFPDNNVSFDIATNIWKDISSDKYFLQKIIAAQSSFLLPTWTGSLSDTFLVKNDLKKYSVLSVDGSQIYPDRNFSGGSCFLINTGSCFLSYADKSLVKFLTEPKLFFQEDLRDENFAFSRDLVDLKREEIELSSLFEQFLLYKKLFGLSSDRTLCFVDGTIIFWMLDGKPLEIRNFFLERYLYYLNQFYKNNLLIAGFISFPKSRELVNLVKIGLCRFDIVDCIKCHKEHDNFPCKRVDDLIDTKIVRSILMPCEVEKNVYDNFSNYKFCRTTIFQSHSNIVNSYPDELKPYFFYLDVGFEIVRVEVPAYVALSERAVSIVSKIAVDQTLKGNGYPVSLSEAHEQAVVKGPDREFFYNLIYNLGIKNKKRFFSSQKSIKKRIPSI